MNGDEKLTPPDFPVAEGPAPEPKFEVETGVGAPPAQPEFFSPETLAPTPIPEGVAKRGGALKTIGLILIALVFVGGVGALSYFVVFPLLFPPEAPVVQRPPVAQPPLATHQSFLVSSPAAVAEIRLADSNYLTIATALQNESFNQLADGQVKEVKISDRTGGQMAFSLYLGSVAPATSALLGANWFENDFTALLYYDANGVWPVYVAKLRAGVDPAAVKSGLGALENILELSNFYLNPPGSFGAWRDGQANNYPARYNVGTQPGAAFNYGIFGNYLILSSNYNGLRTALPALGL